MSNEATTKPTNKETVSIDVNVTAECECKGCGGNGNEGGTKVSERDTGYTLHMALENDYSKMPIGMLVESYKTNFELYKNKERVSIYTGHTLTINKNGGVVQDANELGGLRENYELYKGKNKFVEFKTGEIIGLCETTVMSLTVGGTSKQHLGVKPTGGLLDALATHNSNLTNYEYHLFDKIHAIYTLVPLKYNTTADDFIIVKTVIEHSKF